MLAVGDLVVGSWKGRGNALRGDSDWNINEGRNPRRGKEMNGEGKTEEKRRGPNVGGNWRRWAKW
jgi:hypothetical protein